MRVLTQNLEKVLDTASIQQQLDTVRKVSRRPSKAA